MVSTLLEILPMKNTWPRSGKRRVSTLLEILPYIAFVEELHYSVSTLLEILHRVVDFAMPTIGLDVSTLLEILHRN